MLRIAVVTVALLAGVGLASAERLEIEASGEAPDLVSLGFGVGALALEDGAEGVSTTLAVGVAHGKDRLLLAEYQNIDLGAASEHRFGLAYRHTFIRVFDVLRQYVVMRGFAGYREEGAVEYAGALGIGAELGMGLGLELSDGLELYGEVGYGASSWSDAKQDSFEHFSTASFGLRGTL